VTPKEDPEGVAEDVQPLPPKASGLLAEFLPFELPSMGQALRDLVDPVGDWGEELTDLVSGRDLAPWVLTAGLAAAAYEIARRQMQSPQLAQALAGDYQTPTGVWLPGSVDPSPREQS
jgi:hypothetical protein